MTSGTDDFGPEEAPKENGTTEVTEDRVNITRRLKKESTEMEASEDASPETPFDSSDIPGVGLMYALGTLTPFHSLFLSFANSRYGNAKQHLRVANMIKAHPRMYTWCRRSDYVFRVLVTLTLFLIVAVVLAAGIYKLFLADIIPEVLALFSSPDQ